MKANISKVLDTVSTEARAAICVQAIGPDSGTYCNLLEIECPRADVQSVFFLGYSMSGESYIFEGEQMEAQPEDFRVNMSSRELDAASPAHRRRRVARYQ